MATATFILMVASGVVLLGAGVALRVYAEDAVSLRLTHVGQDLRLAGRRAFIAAAACGALALIALVAPSAALLLWLCVVVALAWVA